MGSGFPDAGPPARLSSTLSASSSPSMAQLTGTVFGVSTVPATLVQGSPTSGTVTDGAGYLGQLTATNAIGTVNHSEQSSVDSADIVVSATGAIDASSSLSPDVCKLGGTDSTASGQYGPSPLS